MTDAQRWLNLMFPSEQRWIQCIRAAAIFEVSPRTVESWKVLPRYARIIASIYTGMTSLADLEEAAYNAV